MALLSSLFANTVGMSLAVSSTRVHMNMFQKIPKFIDKVFGLQARILPKLTRGIPLEIIEFKRM